MKIYLNDKQFVNLFWELMERKMESSHTTHQFASRCDYILWSLFKSYEVVVKDNLESSLYGIDTYDGAEASAWVGYQFHKSFRQIDVIPDKHIDMIIWMCMQDSPVFWKCMNKACKILTDETAAELYNDEVW